ncbi:MAG: acyltransferase [Alphaproteobacteria bacterium]
MPKVYSLDGVTPVVDPSAFVHPTAVVTGDVIIGPECYVGPGASLRGDFGRIIMSRGSNFQDNCIAHTFTGGEVFLGEEANIGHGAVLHGCRLGEHCLIGMNSVVMDGAEVGAYSFVAALAFIRAGFKVPPRVVAAGIPAKVLRDLTEEEIAWKHEADLDYQGLARRSHASLEIVEALTELDQNDPRIQVEGSVPLYMYRKG